MLIYGAPRYRHKFYAQGLSKVAYDDDDNPILAVVPVDPDALFVAKASGGYVLGNLNDTRALFQSTHLMQTLAVPAANQVAAIDGMAFVTNTLGMTALESGKTVEVSRKVRTLTLTGMALTLDYTKRRVIVGESYVYDMSLSKWFAYDGVTFRFTTRQLANPDWSPFAVDRVVFSVRHTTDGDGLLTYAVRYDDEPWSDDFVVTIPNEPGSFTMQSETLDQKRSTRRFQIRVSSLVGVALREILAESDVKQLDDYGT